MTPLLRGAVGRFSLPRKRSLPQMVMSLPAERTRLLQFAGIALLSGLAFVGAAYYQSGRNAARHAAPVATPTAPASAAPAVTVEPVAAPPREEGVFDWKERDSEAFTAPSAREPRRDLAKPRPTSRPRAKKRPGASADLKNPFD